MPDHIHMIVEVKENLPQPITSIIGLIESAVTKRAREEKIIASDVSVFPQNSINDRIVFKKGYLRILKNYIADNPRRYLIKKQHPDLFRRRLGLRMGDLNFDAVGNMFLLRLPMKQVHVRSFWDDGQCEQFRVECRRHVAAGGVLVSPYISPKERAIMKEALQAGGCVIRICDRGFGEGWKPSGEEFELCTVGRLLLLSEAGAEIGKSEMYYAKASHLNALAHILAETPDTTMALMT